MGRLHGFKYREVVKKLRRAGFEFDRYVKGSHEIWRNHETGNEQLFLIIPDRCRKER